ncbi:MAG: response regulator [Elusimicrobia bacterium]|nr:response regulator [Elusimicrobiota bacterium]
MAKTILIIDDDPGMCRLIQRGLNHPDHVIYSATSAEEAKRLLSVKPDLVILDVVLADATKSPELLQEIRSQLPNVPVLLMMSAALQNSKTF